ncbi:MAG: hypothetical protein M3463_11365 [Verrucomicrobiota bacterium]|nr:hypothetical protein [Verrucomicrobiota bacterium]
MILANVPRIDPPQAARIAKHVAAGGGLWMALGDRTDPDAFNRVFAGEGAGLSPIKIGPAIGDLSDTVPGWRILPPDEPHPATMLLRDAARLDLGKARVRRHFTLLEPIPPDLTTLLMLETQAPLVIEQAFGKGRVLIQTVPLNRTWNNLPILHAYVPLVREFLWWIAGGRLSRRNLALGETIRVPVAGSEDAPFAVHLPDGEKAVGQAQGGAGAFFGNERARHLPGRMRRPAP